MFLQDENVKYAKAIEEFELEKGIEMSNAYEDWHINRKEKAWTDLNRIAEIFEDWKNKGSSSSDILYAFLDIAKVIEEGGWL